MSFARRVLKERAQLAVTDLEGERDTLYPLPGSIAFWENELARPLKGSQMDRDVAERIALALEQIALELGDSGVAKTTPMTALAPLTAVVGAPHASWVGNASLGGAAGWQCPIHGGSKVIPAGFSQKTQRPYEAFTVCTENGCVQKPPKVNQLP